MRRLSYGILALLVLVSCRHEDLSWTGPFIELTLTTSSADNLTKADAPGDDDFHENLITCVDLYFYPGEDTLHAATYHVHYTANKRGSEMKRLELTSELINTAIFPSVDDIRTCTVFALVNYYSDDSESSPYPVISDETTLPALRQTVMITNFLNTDYLHKQPYFVMSGKTSLALRGRSQVVAATGTVELVRFACKLTIGVNVADEVVSNGEVWEPMVTGMEAYLVNGVSNTRLSGMMPETPTYLNYKNNPMKFGYEDLEHKEHLYRPKEGNYYQTYPTYMYPQDWVYGSTLSPNKEPYIKLVIPWKRTTGGQKQYYYKIVMPDDLRGEGFRCRFIRNNWYHIDIDVSMLGAELDEASAQLEGTCYIVYWQDKNMVIKDAKIGNARYLSVDRVTRSLYNVSTTVNMSYVSSHPVSLKDLRVVRPYYGTKGAGTKVLGGTVRKASGGKDIYSDGTMYLEYNVSYDSETGQAVYTDNSGNTQVWLVNTGTAILFTHPLINDYKNPLFDYSPYTFHYFLVHADRPNDATYQKEQTIVQYPAIYLECTPNPAEKIIHDGPSSWATDHGYVYVNGEQFSEDDHEAAGKLDSNLWKVVAYNDGGTDMYKITTTVLPPESEFVIGDPRSSEITLFRTDYVEATVLEDDDRVEPTLTYYYPTDESARTRNMIAPAYRISTKLSGTYVSTKITHEPAVQRCSAFQENGFPAGRWRLPTMAEIEFAAQLSANQVFENQFADLYWSANGVVKVNQNTGEVEPAPAGTTVGYIRCVYDSWYWGDERFVNEEDPKKLPNIFVWGDRKR